MDGADNGTDGVDVTTDVSSVSNAVCMTTAVSAHGIAYKVQGHAVDNTLDATDAATVETTDGATNGVMYGAANGASISH